MRDELYTSTAIRTGDTALPGGNANAPTPIGVAQYLPPNSYPNNFADCLQHTSIALPPDAPGPPGNSVDYWNALIDERAAAQFLGMTNRWMQAKRQHGGGPLFVRISKRCIRYRRSDLARYAEANLRASTSDVAI